MVSVVPDITEGGDASTAPSRDAIVLRFSPVSAAAMLRKAEQAYRDCGAYRLSVFASEQWDEETEDDVVQRILAASELQNISPESNQKFWFLSEAGKIYDLGHKLVKYGFEGEIAEHYSVDLGKSATLDDTERIAALFSPMRRDR